MIIFFAILASVAALIGGWLAFRFRDQFHLVLALAAGLLLGAAFFDLLPESISVGGGADLSTGTMLAIAVVGFLTFYVLDSLFGLHPHDEAHDHHHAGHLGVAGAGGMGVHSLLDGVGIGVAFQGGMKLGLLVGVAVVGHRFSDGLNTVTLLRRGGQSLRAVRGWLTVVAVAPVVGAGLSYGATIPNGVLACALAFFAGMFLYISTADLLPEAHHAHATRWTIIFTLAGAGVLFGLTRLASL